jgi:uncharacterized protein with PIN domain
MRPKNVRIRRAGDLIYWTYFMVDWKGVAQTPSDQVCVQCGKPMLKIGPVEDPKGRKFDGLVCHGCRRLLWARQG